MSKLLEINPKELKFTVELKKQSSCSVQLTNITNYYVAFKVKTTSPKKYCVRPNVGIVKPNSSCDFTVVMQVPRGGPLDLECKDKFLIQSTTVSAETTDEDITAGMFLRDIGNYVEEKKLKVILIGPPDSPTLSPINGTLSPGLGRETSFFREQSVNGFETQSKPHRVIEDKEEPVQENIKESEAPSDRKTKHVKSVLFKLENDVVEPVNGVEELKQAKYVEKLNPVEEIGELKPVTNVQELSPLKYVNELKPLRDIDESNQAKDVEESNPATASVVLKPAKNVDESNPAIAREVLKPVKNVEEPNPGMNREVLKPVKKTEETKPAIDVGLKTVRDVELKPEKAVEFINAKCIIEDSKLVKDVQEMKSKLSEFELKFSKAEFTISKLMVERNSNIEERKFLHEKLAELGRRDVKTVQVGFPLLFVCMVALISVFIGYQLHP